MIHGPREFAALYERLHGAFPDIKITVEDTFGADDTVVVRWSADMTHTGDGLGLPATNKRAKITGITIAQIENGKIVHGWDNWDQLAMQQQIAMAAVAHS